MSRKCSDLGFMKLLREAKGGLCKAGMPGVGYCSRNIINRPRTSASFLGPDSVLDPGRCGSE